MERKLPGGFAPAGKRRLSTAHATLVKSGSLEDFAPAVLLALVTAVVYFFLTLLGGTLGLPALEVAE